MLITVLVVVLVVLQYRAWFGDGSVQEVWRLRNEAREKNAEVLRLRNRNQALEAEVVDLKKGLDAIEERARSELGMISPDETFYQFVRDPNASGNASEGVVGLPEMGGNSGSRPRSTAESISGAADISRQ